MEKRYEFLEHTADAKIRAYGKTTEERFKNAAAAMFTLILDTAQISGDIEKGIEVKGNDIKQLFYNFMEELLFLIDADRFFMKEIKDIRIEEGDDAYILKATLVGDTHKDEYVIHGDVKAMTYAEMDIKDDYIQFVVDI